MGRLWYAVAMATSDDEVLDRPEVDALYALDPHEFVSARDALSKELKAEGDSDAARIVKALKRPTKVAWALNQVAREHADEVAALLDAGARLRDRQAEALSGGDADALRDAAAERRDRLRDVVAMAVARGGDGVREDATGSLDVASIDPDAGAALAAGRLTAAIPRPADLGFGGMPDPPTRPTSRGPRAPASGSARRRAPAPEPPPPVRLDRRRIDKLERELRRAAREADAAEDDLADAERRLRRAEEALADASERAKAMADAHADAERARDAAATAVERAQRELDDATGG